MKLFLLGVGVTGTLPSRHTYRYLKEYQSEVPASFQLPGLLRNEQKIQLITSAASAALAGLNAQQSLQSQCGCIVSTRWDGRFPTLTDERDGRLLSTADLPPSRVALTLVAHVAESCIPMLFNLQGPSCTISSKQGLQAALEIAALFLTTGRAPLMLAQEFDLALPVNLCQAGFEPQASYALSVIVALQPWDRKVLGEIIV